MLESFTIYSIISGLPKAQYFTAILLVVFYVLFTKIKNRKFHINKALLAILIGYTAPLLLVLLIFGYDANVINAIPDLRLYLLLGLCFGICNGTDGIRTIFK